jgi:Domain of unknown function (DUF4936)
MQTLFVYYKLPQAEHAIWLNQVRAFIAQVQTELPQLEISLMLRPQASSEGIETWMEIYRAPQGLDDEAIKRIEQLAEQHAWPSKRASEVFVEMNS